MSQLPVLAVSPAPHFGLQGGKHLLVLGDTPSHGGEGEGLRPGASHLPQQPRRHCGDKEPARKKVRLWKI